MLETEEDVHDCVRTLCDKGYLRLNEKKEYLLDSTLELVLDTAEHPYGYFIMKDLRQDGIEKKTGIFFLNDVITIVEEKETGYELLWLPYLPLAVGKIANLHTPFLNNKVLADETEEESDAGCIDAYIKSGFRWQWEIWGKQLEDEERIFNMYILSDGTSQLMVKELDDKIFVSKPGKAAYVNAITVWLTLVHGSAIKKMLQEA